MPEEKFDYEKYAQSMYDQALELIPNDIKVVDKEYLAKTIKRFIQMTADAMQNQYPNYDSNTIIFISQVISEWTYHKGIDIIRANIPKKYMEGLLMKVAFVAYETIDENIKKGTSQELLLERVEKDIKKNFFGSINELRLRKCITEDVAKKAIELSNIDDVNKNTNTKIEIKPIKYKADDEIFDFMREDLEEQFANNDENAATIQEKIQMQEYQRNYWTNQIENEPDNPEGYFNMSEVERENNPKVALEYINKAIELDVNNGNFYAQRALIYKQIANTSTYDTTSMEELFELSRVPYEKEIADLTKALAMNFEPKETLLYERGLAKVEIFEELDAKEDFKTVIDINSNFVEPYYELAKIEIKQEQYQAAIEHLDKAIELQPDSSILYLSRGEAKEKGGNIKGAKEDYMKAQELNPEDDWAEYHLDCIESSENQDKNFNIEYEKCTKYINDNSSDPDGYFNRGYLLACNDVDDDIALSDFDKAIELNPNFVDAYKHKTYIYEHNGQYEKIIPIYKKIIELEPTLENYDYFLRYLNTYIENGSQKALKICEKIFELFPASSKLYELRGSTYYNLKDYDNAIADYKKAVELNPKEYTLKIILKQIEQEKNENIS